MFENVRMVNQPENMKIDLYPHQLASIYSMEELERNRKVVTENYELETCIGINSDITGMGKTLSMIGLVLRDKMSWDTLSLHRSIKSISYAGHLVRKNKIEKFERLNTTLILASKSIIKQWEKELSYTSLKVKTIYKKTDTTTEPNHYDVFLVIPSMFNILVLNQHNFAWKRFIYDEPGHIRVPAMRKIIAGFYWFVTATPEAIVRKHINCNKSFMQNIVRNSLYSSRIPWNWGESFTRRYELMIIRNDINFINLSYRLPKTQHIYHQCYKPIYRFLKEFASQRIQQLVDAGDILGAVSILGGNTTNNIVELLKNKKEKEIKVYKTEIRVAEVRENDELKNIWIEKLKRAEDQLVSLESRYEELLNGSCPVCLDSIKDPILEPSCQNIFCGECLLKWLSNKNRCPLCVQEVKREDLVYIKNNNANKCETDNKLVMTKENIIIKLVNDNPDGRFILFSSSDETFRPIRSFLTEKELPFVEVIGSIEKRNRNISRFKEGKVRIMFLNTKNNGAGINLQEATDIILYHKLSESTQKQVIGRALRIGRKTPLNVHHLTYS